jgi:hypothetical protein
VGTSSIDLLQGTLDVLVLKTLSWGPRHGYAVARGLQQLTDDVLQIEEGSLYPALHPHGTARVGGKRVGPLREQSPGEVLQAHDRRSQTASRRVIDVVGVLAGRFESPWRNGSAGLNWMFAA